MPPTETPDVADHAALESAELWTSDSERGLGTTDPLPSGATDPEPIEPAAPAEPLAAEAATDRDTNGQFKPKSKKPRTDPEARVQQATGDAARARDEAKAAREETAKYKAELEAARRPVAPAPVVPQATTGDFPEFEAWSEQTKNTDWNAYNRAVVRHEASQVLQQARAEESEQRRVTLYQQRIQEGLTRYPDLSEFITANRTAFDEALDRRGVRGIPPVMRDAIVDSEFSPEIVRFLGTHPDEGAQLAADVQHLPVTAASVVRRLLEFQSATTAVPRPESASPVRPSAAKAPVTRVGGTANATPADPEDLEFGPEYIRLENAREKKRQEAGRW